MYAAGIWLTITPTLTFNNKITFSAVTLVKQSDSSVVSATQEWDTAGKVLTVTPTSSLTSGAVYEIVVAGTTDIYGQELSASVIKFTVAS